MKKMTKIRIFLFIVLGIFLMQANSCKKNEDKKSPEETVTDIDGNVYHIVTIGAQDWLVENLKVTHYRNGDPIPNVTDDLAWELLETGAYCNYDNLPANGTIYGRLYNWYAVNDQRKIAPIGWHVSSDDEWTKLTDFLGGDNVAGGKLKEKGMAHWKDPNSEATNVSGFTALPGGHRNFAGGFDYLQWGCGFWTSTPSGDNATVLYLD